MWRLGGGDEGGNGVLREDWVGDLVIGGVLLDGRMLVLI